MKDDEVIDLVLTHDKHIEVMSQSIEHLADAVGTTNRKMESIIDVLSSQNVLMERVNNMDENLKESFTRVHRSIQDNADKLLDLEDESKEKLPNWVLKWALWSLIAYSISFGTYTVQHIHSGESALNAHLTASVVRNVNVDDKLKTVDTKLIHTDNLLNRNYGAITSLKK